MERKHTAMDKNANNRITSITKVFEAGVRLFNEAAFVQKRKLAKLLDASGMIKRLEELLEKLRNLAMMFDLDDDEGNTEQPISPVILMLRSRIKRDYFALKKAAKDPLMHLQEKEPVWITRDRQLLAIEIGTIANRNLENTPTLLLAIQMLSAIANGSAHQRLINLQETLREQNKVDQMVMQELTESIQKFIKR